MQSNSPNLTIGDWRTLAQDDPTRAADTFLERLNASSRVARQRAVWWKPERTALATAFARGAGVDSALGGVPYGLKDLFDFVGAPTTAGSDFLAAVRPEPRRDSNMVEHLTRQGAVMACKTATVEFAYGLSGENRWFGDCPHPRIAGALAGGSSSGSAWLVGAGIAPFAIGTDTAGSMRVPAAYCGIFSWRDVPGEWVQHGCIPLAISFDAPGWFAPSADELARLNGALLSPDTDLTSLRILDLSAICPSLADELREPTNALLRQVGATRDPEVVSAAIKVFANAAQTYNVLGSCEAFAYHAKWLDRHRSRYDPVVWQRIDRGRNWAEPEIADARNHEAMVQQKWEELLAEFDAVAFPVTPLPSPTKADLTPACREMLLALSAPASLGRLPALTAPVTLPDGRSGGLQFVIANNEKRGAVAQAILKRLSDPAN